MNAFEKSLKSKIKELTSDQLENYTPSLQIAVLKRGQKIGQLKLGEKAKYFDLASLTKVIFGVSKLMELEQAGLLSINDPVHKFWPEFPQKKIRIRELMTHTAGMKEWAPFYKTLKNIKDPERKQQALEKLILKQDRRKDKKAVYSDIDFLILSKVLTSATGVELLPMWQNLGKKLGVSKIHFCPGNKPKYKKSDYAPTEKCPWRKKHLRGEVHDDNTWSMDGVSTHAGLFGDLKSVEKFGQLLRQAYFNGSKLASKKIARNFLSRAIPTAKGDFTVGYMMPSKSGSTAGQYFSPKSVGHTGFTGTSIWFDPRKDLLIVILSNRVSPTRDNLKFRALRPLLHDAIVNLI